MQEQRSINIFKSFLIIIFQVVLIFSFLYFAEKSIHNFADANGDYSFFIVFGILVFTLVIMFLTVIACNLRRSINGLGSETDFLTEFMTEKSIGANVYSYHKSLDDTLNEILNGVCYAAGLKKVPALYIVSSFIPTAFAYGANINDCKIFVTSGLIKILNNDEMSAVIASQIGHIVNRDITFFYCLTPLVRVYMNIIRGLFRDIFVEREDKDDFLSDYLLCAFVLRKPFVIHPVWLLISVVSFVVPLIMSIFYMLLSQKRIYYADMFAVKITRNPKALSDALTKIHTIISLPEDTTTAFYNKMFNGNNSDAAMFLNDDVLLSKDPLLNSCFIVPVMRKLEGDGIFCTHPHIKKRIKNLSSMTKIAF